MWFLTLSELIRLSERWKFEPLNIFHREEISTLEYCCLKIYNWRMQGDDVVFFTYMHLCGMGSQLILWKLILVIRVLLKMLISQLTRNISDFPESVCICKWFSLVLNCFSKVTHLFSKFFFSFKAVNSNCVNFTNKCWTEL